MFLLFNTWFQSLAGMLAATDSQKKSTFSQSRSAPAACPAVKRPCAQAAIFVATLGDRPA